MVDAEIVREWITKADDDFDFALANLEEEKPFLALICFHFQQSAEKYLKAYIVAHDLEFKKTHDLHALLKTCIEKDASLHQFNTDCEFLNTFYIEARYPVHWPTHFTKEEADKARRAAGADPQDNKEIPYSCSSKISSFHYPERSEDKTRDNSREESLS